MFFLVLVMSILLSCSEQQRALDSSKALTSPPTEPSPLFYADESWNGYDSREDWDGFKEGISLSAYTYSCQSKEPIPADAPIGRVVYLVPGIAFTSVQLIKNKPVDASLFMGKNFKTLKLSFNESTSELTLPTHSGDDLFNKLDEKLSAHVKAGVFKCQKGFVEPEKQVTVPEQKNPMGPPQATP